MGGATGDRPPCGRLTRTGDHGVRGPLGDWPLSLTSTILFIVQDSFLANFLIYVFLKTCIYRYTHFVIVAMVLSKSVSSDTLWVYNTVSYTVHGWNYAVRDQRAATMRQLVRCGNRCGNRYDDWCGHRCDNDATTDATTDATSEAMFCTITNATTNVTFRTTTSLDNYTINVDNSSQFFDVDSSKTTMRVSQMFRVVAFIWAGRSRDFWRQREAAACGAKLTTIMYGNLDFTTK